MLWTALKVFGQFDRSWATTKIKNYIFRKINTNYHGSEFAQNIVSRWRIRDKNFTCTRVLFVWLTNACHHFCSVSNSMPSLRDNVGAYDAIECKEFFVERSFSTLKYDTFNSLPLGSHIQKMNRGINLHFLISHSHICHVRYEWNLKAQRARPQSL